MHPVFPRSRAAWSARCGSFCLLFTLSCQGVSSGESSRAAVHVAPQPVHGPAVLAAATMLAGIRFSAYSAAGQMKGPDPVYWDGAAHTMAQRFSATPAVLWTVGEVVAPDHIRLSFPRPTDAQGLDPHIEFSATDEHQAALRSFDQSGTRVWLQVEPGGAPVTTVIDLVLKRYGSHPSVVGVSIDAEWLGVAIDNDGAVISGGAGIPVSDTMAADWLATLRSHGPNLKLALKHWQVSHMPATLRDNLLFIGDGQGYGDLDAMLTDFATFARLLAPANVAFLYGYKADQNWWCHLPDAPHDIGKAVLDAVPEVQGLFWVDFTALHVFPRPDYTCSLDTNAATGADCSCAHGSVPDGLEPCTCPRLKV